MSQEERKTLEDKIGQESAQAVRLFYLSRQIVQGAKIPVTHKEVQNEAIRPCNPMAAKHPKSTGSQRSLCLGPVESDPRQSSRLILQNQKA